MANIDLDAARRARDEARGEGHTLTFQGVTYQLPAELGYEVAEGLTQGDWRTIMRSLLGDEQADEFFKQAPTVVDLRTLLNGDESLGIKGVLSLYGTTEEGESTASSSLSNGNGSPSRQPSNSGTA